MPEFWVHCFSAIRVEAEDEEDAKVAFLNQMREYEPAELEFEIHPVTRRDHAE